MFYLDSKKLLETAVEFAKKRRYNKREKKLLKRLALLYESKGDLNEASKYYKESGNDKKSKRLDSKLRRLRESEPTLLDRIRNWFA